MFYDVRALVLRPAEILVRIDRGRTLADLEMQLRRGHVAGLPGMRDHLPALDGVITGPCWDYSVSSVLTVRHVMAVAEQSQAALQSPTGWRSEQSALDRPASCSWALSTFRRHKIG